MADDDAPDGADNLEGYLRDALSSVSDSAPARAPDAQFLPATSPLSENIEDRRTTLNDDPAQEGRHISNRVGKTTPNGWDTIKNGWYFADGGSVPDEAPAPQFDDLPDDNQQAPQASAPVMFDDLPDTQQEDHSGKDFDSLPHDEPAPESAMKTIGRKLVNQAIPFTASLAAMGPGAGAGAAAGLPLAPFTLGASVPVGAAIGAGAAGFAANWLVSAAQDKIESMLGIDDSAQREANAKAHSTADMVADIIPMAAAFKVGQLGGSLVSRGINAAAMGGISAGQQLATTGTVDPAETAEQAALGAIFNEPRSGTAKLMSLGHPAGPAVPGRPDLQGDQSPKDDVHVAPPPSGQPGVASDPVRPTQRQAGDAIGGADGFRAEGSERDLAKDTSPTGNGAMVTQGETDPTLQAALADPAIQSMAQPRPEQKPLTQAPDTGLAAASPQRPPAAQAAIEGRPPQAPDPTPAPEATPAPGEVPPSAQQATDPSKPFLPNVQVERADLPPGYIARSDNDGTKVYLAPGVPETLDVNGHTVPVADALKVHEVFERRGIAMLQKAIADGRHAPMSDDKIYDVAHQKVGTAAERAYLEEHVGTPTKPFTDADFTEYQRQLADISRAQKGGGTPPADLYKFMDAHEAHMHLHTAAGHAGDDVTAAARNAREAESAVHAKVRADQGSEAEGDITGSLNPDRTAAPQQAGEDDKFAAALRDFNTKPNEVTATVKEAPGLKPLLKLVAEHPTMDPAAKAELSAKLKVAPPEVVAKAYEGLRPRQRAAVEGLGVTARTKADAARKQGAIDAAKAAFDKHVPTSDVMPVGAAAARELHARLSAAVKEAGPEALAYKPRVQPAATQWLRAADKLVRGKMTPKQMTEFATMEKQLRSGKAEDAQAVQAEKRTEADISMSRRSGEEAVDHAQAQHVDPYAEEDAMIERIDATRNPQRTLEAFDTPHEEGAEGRTAEPVATREDLERLDQRTGGKELDLKNMSHEELLQLAEDMAKKPETEGKPQWKIDEEARAEKTANLKALRLARAGAVALRPEVEARARSAWSERQVMRGDRAFAPSARPTSRKALDIAGPKGRSFLEATKLKDPKLKDGKLASSAGEREAPGGASAKILSHLDKRYPDAGAYNTHAKPTAKDEYFASIHDKLAQINQQDTADATAIRKQVDAMPAELTENTARLERIYRAVERGDLDSLDQPSRELYNKWLKPLVDMSNTLAANMRRLSPDKIGQYVANHLQRIRRGYDPELDVLNKTADPITGEQGVSTARRGAMNDRTFSALERVSDGKRFVVSPDPKGKGYTKWQGGIGTHVAHPDFEHVAGKDFSNGGIDYKMRDAYTDEIEKNAKFADNKPARYYHNPVLSLAATARDLASQARHIQFVNNLRTDPRFMEATTSSKKEAEARGFVPTKMPQFDGTYMDPNLARVLDQYTKPGFDTPEALRAGSQEVTKLLFWMPTAHIANVGTHWFVGRGWDWIKPMAYRNLALSSVQAIRSVMSQDAMQLDLYNRNAGLRLGAVLNKDWLQNIAEKTGETVIKPHQWEAFGKVFGYGVEEMKNAVYQGSSRVMWAANDMFLTQQILENQMKGMTKEMAISHAERHIPNYRIPATLISNGTAGRAMAKWMEDPVFSSFGRYHYGVFNSYANIAHDMLDKSSTGKQRLEAVGNVMALGLLALAVKPMLDMMAQAVTGDKNSEVHARGPLALPSQLGRVAKGQDDLMSPVRNMASMPPAITTALEALRNKDFSNHDIVQAGDTELAAHGSPRALGRAAVAEGEHTVRGLVSPVNTAANAFGKGQGPMAALRDQALDIKEPSAKAVKYDATQPAKAERAAVAAKPRGPMAALYDKMFGRGR